MYGQRFLEGFYTHAIALGIQAKDGRSDSVVGAASLGILDMYITAYEELWRIRDSAVFSDQAYDCGTFSPGLEGYAANVNSLVPSMEWGLTQQRLIEEELRFRGSLVDSVVCDSEPMTPTQYRQPISHRQARSPSVD